MFWDTTPKLSATVNHTDPAGCVAEDAMRSLQLPMARACLSAEVGCAEANSISQKDCWVIYEKKTRWLYGIRKRMEKETVKY